MYICPICRTELTLYDKEAKCSNNHSFNRAKQGYYHLLPANKKSSKAPGDTKEMISARAEFLALGGYLKLAQFIALTLPESINALLDLGCGDGYFSRFLLAEKSIKNLVAVDISKESVKFASKHDKNGTYLVASNFSLPIADNSVDTILINFAPVNASELLRVLKPDGKVVRVVPAENHLEGLKQRIYDKLRAPPSTDLKLNGMQLIQQDRVEYQTALNRQQKCSLLTMTPLYWKVTPKVQEDYLEQQERETFSFIVAQYRVE